MICQLAISLAEDSHNSVAGYLILIESPGNDAGAPCILSRPEEPLQGRTEVYEREGESEV